MFNAKTIILAKALRPDLNFASPGAEELIWLKIASRYASGNPVRNATISNGIAYFDGVTVSQPLVSLKLNIPVTQTGSGTPSPDNIRDFIGFSGVNVSRTGKNLFDINSDKITGAYISSTGAIVYQAGQDIYTEKIKFKPSIRYTISGKSDTNTIIRIALYSANNSFIGRVLSTSMQNPVVTIMPTSQASYFVINPDNTITDIQVEEGQQATAYEPFGNTYSISFGQTVYSANLDVLTGKLSITHSIVDLGDLTWRYGSGSQVFYTEDITDMSEAIPFDNMACSGFETLISTTSFVNMPNYSIKRGQSNTTIYVKDTDYTDADAFKTAVTGMKLVYELATPIEVQLTPTVINTLIGENMIFADVADVTECKYTRK
jgi:hypothetical protein